MAVVICQKCGLQYDDVYRWTYCPHERFRMRTLAVRTNSETGETEEKICTSLTELADFLGEGFEVSETQRIIDQTVAND